MYALRTSAAISGIRGGAPVSDEYYERNASNVATNIILKTGAPGAAAGFAAGGPIGAVIGFFASAILFGAPEALERDRQYNEKQRRGR